MDTQYEKRAFVSRSCHIKQMLRRFLLRLILEEAIRREEEAYRFYEAALEPVRAAEARALLRKLSPVEAGGAAARRGA
jgi:hypothetical protein